MQRQDARGAYLEILDPSGLDLAASRGACVLDSHQQTGLDNVLGTLDAVRVEGSEVVGLIRFSTRPEIAARVEDVREGIVQHLSVGYQVGRMARRHRRARQSHAHRRQVDHQRG